MTEHPPNPIKDAFNTILDYILDLEAKVKTQAQPEGEHEVSERDINYANYTKGPIEESQITGWVVLISKGSIVQQVVGTPTGRLIQSEHAASILAEMIAKNSNADAIALPLVSPASLTLA